MEVTEPPPPPVISGEGTLQLDKTTFAPGEQIQVHFTADASFPGNAWVGIIPSDVPHGSETENDANDLTYQYLGGQTSGTLAFAAPGEPGSYDFRMHDTDDDGREVASVTFTVTENPEEQGPNLRLDKTTFAPGEEIQVHFTADASFPSNAWVGIIPSDVPHGSETENDANDLTYQYLSGRTSGTLVFAAPDQPGSYDFRMHDTDDEGREVASVTFTVE